MDMKPVIPAQGSEKPLVSREQAAQALDSMDDYARMTVGVDAKGPRGVLERFIQQAIVVPELEGIQLHTPQQVRDWAADLERASVASKKGRIFIVQMLRSYEALLERLEKVPRP